ncbi:hypothetical protein GNI_157110 [Gregarina niphandrodes]|uniref:Uncharacterized protein n=1 Tax=Gregarina niphandrodes TaxID=110365 RepID=A0A023AZ20_GRENI|nr:hypothetical protein GNI_157110 [Gregarina niphandrodes]EZG43871.1 hypothetical protein GNI_157110 [Gregarina niphandrodes]|eukprot:XP_011132959.1 hypothetical protein GNI_157110 [Gregarina niphandrodes]
MKSIDGLYAVCLSSIPVEIEVLIRSARYGEVSSRVYSQLCQAASQYGLTQGLLDAFANLKEYLKSSISWLGMDCEMALAIGNVADCLDLDISQTYSLIVSLFGCEASDKRALALGRVCGLLCKRQEDVRASYCEFLKEIIVAMATGTRVENIEGLVAGVEFLNLYFYRYRLKPSWNLEADLSTLSLLMETIKFSFDSSIVMSADEALNLVNSLYAIGDSSFYDRCDILIASCMICRLTLVGQSRAKQLARVQMTCRAMGSLLDEWLFPVSLYSESGTEPGPEGGMGIVHSLENLTALSLVLVTIWDDCSAVPVDPLSQFTRRLKSTYGPGSDLDALLDIWTLGADRALEHEEEQAEERLENQVKQRAQRDLFEPNFTDEETDRVKIIQDMLVEKRGNLQKVPRKGYLLACYRYALCQSESWQVAIESVARDPESFCKKMPRIFRNLSFATTPNKLLTLLTEYAKTQTAAKRAPEPYKINAQGWDAKNKTIRMAREQANMGELEEAGVHAWGTQDELETFERKREEAEKEQLAIEEARRANEEWRAGKAQNARQKFKKTDVLPPSAGVPSPNPDRTPATNSESARQNDQEDLPQEPRMWGPDKRKGGYIPKPQTNPKKTKPVDKHHARDKRAKKLNQ